MIAGADAGHRCGMRRCNRMDQETKTALVASIAGRSHPLERVGWTHGKGDFNSNEDDNASGVISDALNTANPAEEAKKKAR